MPHLLSVNVGLPREVTWNGKTVRTAIWKFPVEGRRRLEVMSLSYCPALLPRHIPNAKRNGPGGRS